MRDKKLIILLEKGLAKYISLQLLKVVTSLINYFF
jgi:hypothetical protein